MATSQRGAPARGETRTRGQDAMAWTPPERARTRRGDRVREREQRPRSERRQVLQRHATVRKVDPWSVLKLSLIFYFCVLLVVMLGLTLFWAAVNNVGLVDTVLGFLGELNMEVTLDGGSIGRAVFFLGVLNVVLWSGINVFLAFLYNLVADLVGGLRVTLGEED